MHHDKAEFELQDWINIFGDVVNGSATNYVFHQNIVTKISLNM